MAREAELKRLAETAVERARAAASLGADVVAVTGGAFVGPLELARVSDSGGDAARSGTPCGCGEPCVWVAVEDVPRGGLLLVEEAAEVAVAAGPGTG